MLRQAEIVRWLCSAAAPPTLAAAADPAALFNQLRLGRSGLGVTSGLDRQPAPQVRHHPLPIGLPMQVVSSHVVRSPSNANGWMGSRSKAKELVRPPPSSTLRLPSLQSQALESRSSQPRKNILQAVLVWCSGLQVHPLWWGRCAVLCL
jgi:hypothetical protein